MIRDERYGKTKAWIMTIYLMSWLAALISIVNKL